MPKGVAVLVGVLTFGSGSGVELRVASLGCALLCSTATVGIGVAVSGIASNGVDDGLGSPDRGG